MSAAPTTETVVTPEHVRAEMESLIARTNTAAEPLTPLDARGFSQTLIVGDHFSARVVRFADGDLHVMLYPGKNFSQDALQMTRGYRVELITNVQLQTRTIGDFNGWGIGTIFRSIAVEEFPDIKLRLLPA